MCGSVPACVCVRVRGRVDGKWKGVREERGTRVQRGEAGGREEPGGGAGKDA